MISAGGCWHHSGTHSILTHILQRFTLYFLNSSSPFSSCMTACIDFSLTTIPVTPCLLLYQLVTVTRSPFLNGLFLFSFCCVIFISIVTFICCCLPLICCRRFCMLFACICIFLNSSVSISISLCIEISSLSVLFYIYTKWFFY